jgi:hypothetical protein
VLTAAPVLATLAQVIADGKVDVSGALDQTQIEEVQASGARRALPRGSCRCCSDGRVRPVRRQALDPMGPGTVTTTCTRR